MKYVDEFRDSKLARPLIYKLQETMAGPLRIMEVCGTHTMAIFRNGIRSILPEGFELLSGPGCPVCVTSASHMDCFIAMADMPHVRLAIFGDLFRVPGTNGSLSDAGGRGARIDIVYSPMDALQLAKDHPDELIVFLGVGFETTTPAIAATILAAKTQRIDNFTVFSTHKVMPPPLHALLADPDLTLDGLLCPGHVSSIIGAHAYQGLVDTYNLSCVVAGFETTDILNGLILLAKQRADNTARVENCYTRAVGWQGNRRALDMIEMIFEPCDMEWRGLGTISESGLAIRKEYALFDAEKRLGITLPASEEPKGCRCGDILKGKLAPTQCPLYGTRCTTANPIGPCMVSSEGTCAAYFKYGSH